MVLFQDGYGNTPDGAVAEEYWGMIDEPTFPVLADVEAASVAATPYEARALPGVCLLSPQMEIVECTAGFGEAEAMLETLEAHATR